jgi:hypothetical protein
LYFALLQRIQQIELLSSDALLHLACWCGCAATEEKRSRRISRILAFAVPTLCDATGTTLMNVGLIYT